MAISRTVLHELGLPANFDAAGLRHGFSLGVDVTKMRGRAVRCAVRRLAGVGLVALGPRLCRVFTFVL